MTLDRPTYRAFADRTLRFYSGGEEVLRLHLKPDEAREIASLLLAMARKDTP